MYEIMEQAIDRGKAGGFSVDEAQHAIQVLTINADQATALVTAGILPLLEAVLTGQRARSPDDPDDVLLKCARSCLNISYIKGGGIPAKLIEVCNLCA